MDGCRECRGRADEQHDRNRLRYLWDGIASYGILKVRGDRPRDSVSCGIVGFLRIYSTMVGWDFPLPPVIELNLLNGDEVFHVTS